MGKVTFVVEYEDGKEPPVQAGMTIWGGLLCGVAWNDALEEKAIPVSESLPEPNKTVLLFDANGEGWVIGWRSVWTALGMKDTGKWEWTFQIDGLRHEDANITHYALIPDDPEVVA